jgi:cytochrome c
MIMVRFKLAAMVLVATLALSQPARAAGDAVLGQKLFLQCRACHTVDTAGTNAIGPNLRGVVGARAGTKSDYPYSPAMMKSGIVWNPLNLDKFLTQPSAMVPGTKMAFAGLSAKPMRDALVAYLATLSGPRR